VVIEGATGAPAEPLELATIPAQPELPNPTSIANKPRAQRFIVYLSQRISLGARLARIALEQAAEKCLALPARFE
jgi:hypothetical protein